MQRNMWHPVSGFPDILVGQYMVPNFVSNSVSVRLSENEYLLYSPGASLLKTWPYACAKGIKLHIVMPNAYHYMGVTSWLAKFNDVTLYASDKAVAQLYSKKVFPSSITISSVSKLVTKLPKDFEVCQPVGHRAGDLWLIKYNENKSSIWITCDSFLNYDRVSNRTIARFMQKLLGAAPGLKISQVIKWFILDDRQGFKSWALDRLAKDNPVVLIPSHGEVLQSQTLSNQLAVLLNTRL